MVISESHQFVFLAVPKTGTSSVEHALAPYASPITGDFKKHATCARVHQELPGDMWSRYFKFAFVRNPYDRMQSWYFYRQRSELANPAHPRHHLYTGDESFDEFIETFGQRDWMLLQLAWVAPPALGGDIQMDFVGRYESLEKDYGEICQRLNIPRRELPKVRSSNNSSDAASLWNSHTRQLVNEYFEKDFALFDYEMLWR